MKGNAQELLFTRKFTFPLGTDCLQKACCHPHTTRWVACDECGRWFHCLCVGLKRNAETVDFICCHCCWTFLPWSLSDNLYTSWNLSKRRLRSVGCDVTCPIIDWATFVTRFAITPVEWNEIRFLALALYSTGRGVRSTPSPKAALKLLSLLESCRK